MARLVGSAKAAKAASSLSINYTLYKRILIIKVFFRALGQIVKKLAPIHVLGLRPHRGTGIVEP